MVNEDRPSSSGGGGAVMDSSQEVSDSAREGADNAGEGAESGMISINVKLLGGGDFAMDVDRNIAISDLKTRVRERTEVEEDRQRLIYRGKVLVDSESLSTYKVETGHSLHMVARPRGFVPPSSETSAAAGVAANTQANQAANRPAATAASARAGALGQRVLMGMGMGVPAFGQGGVTGAGGGMTAGVAGNPAGLGVSEFQGNPGDLTGDNFLSNMLGLASGAAGGAAGSGGGIDLIAGQLSQPQNSVTGAVEPRGARALGGRDAAATGAPAHASAGALGGGAATAHAHRGSGGREAEEEGQLGLEHIRQGLLTLHTLLSGLETRNEQNGPPTVTSAASPAVSDAADASEHRSATAGSNPAVTTLADNEAATTAVAPDRVVSAEQTTGSVEVDESNLATSSPASSRVSRSAKDGDELSASDGASTTWLPASSSTSNAISTSSASSEDEDSGRAPGVSDSAQASEMSPPCPISEGAVRRGAGRRASTTMSRSGVFRPESRMPSSGTVSSSDGVPELMSSSGESGVFPMGSRSLSSASNSSSSISTDAGPPDLVSSSGESDGWGEANQSRSLRSFLRRSRTSAAGGTAEEEKKEEGVGETGRRCTRKFFVGQWLDVKDTVHNWLEATVMDISDSGTQLQIHYNGWPPRWDEWLSWDSPRIAPFRTRTQHLPHAQHVSPAPISAVRNAPITGTDDVRVVMPEVSRVLQEIGPMVEELSACYARCLEHDASTPPAGERSVSHTLPWTRQRVNDNATASAVAADSSSDADPKASELASDVAPLLDRLGRMLTDVAPHLARMGMGNRAEDGAEPGEVRRGNAATSRVRRRTTGLNRRLQRQPQARSRSPDRSPDTAFRQLVSTSNPAPTSSNINIHIHAIVPLRAPPSPPPPPPPPPTAAASAVATPTRADRPPLAVGGSRGSPWAGGFDAAGAPASLIAAARAAVASRGSSSRDPDTPGGAVGTPRSLSRGIVADSPRSLLARALPDGPVVLAAASSSGGSVRSTRSRSASAASSSPSIDVGVEAGHRGGDDGSAVAREDIALTPASGSSAAVHSEPIGDRPGSDGGDIGADHSPTDGSSGNSGGQRRAGGWRSLLRALGVGGGGSSSRVGGRRDGSEGDPTAP